MISSRRVLGDSQAVINPRRPRRGVMDVQKAQSQPQSAIIVTHATRNRLQRKTADGATTKSAVTSNSICSFNPRMTDVRLDMGKLQVQHSSDGSDKGSNEVWSGLRGLRLSSTPGVDGTHTVPVYNKSTANGWELKDP